MDKKVLIADDHPLIRKGLKQIIEDIPGIICAGEACTGTETLEKVQLNNYDLVILDISMPGNNGMDTLKKIRKLKPKLPVLVLTIHPEEEYGLRAIRAGASGYLNKTKNGTELEEAVKTLLDGHKYITDTLAEKLAYSSESFTQPTFNPILTETEYQVLQMIAKGYSVSKIAQQLSKSNSVIYHYRRSIFKKTQTRNNTELIYYAMENNLIADVNLKKYL